MKELNQDALEAYVGSVMNYMAGEVVSLMIHIGDRLGLYNVLKNVGPITPNQLAERTNLNERWLLEWLRGQTAAGLLKYHGEDQFELTLEGGMVLADTTSPTYLAGAFGEPTPPTTVDKIADAFSTGIGMTWNDHGPNVAHTFERASSPAHAQLPYVMKLVDGLSEKLNDGALVVDIGCGPGVALENLAKAYPTSQFVGYDPSSIAINRAIERVGYLSNVSFEIRDGESLPAKPTYDLVLTLDCMHEMTNPGKVTQAIKQAIQPDGVWIIKEARCSDKLEENFDNPFAAMLYGVSIIYCMSSAMSEPGGAGLGTLGFNPKVGREITQAAGFSKFKEIDYKEDMFNSFFEVRP